MDHKQIIEKYESDKDKIIKEIVITWQEQFKLRVALVKQRQKYDSGTIPTHLRDIYELLDKLIAKTLSLEINMNQRKIIQLKKDLIETELKIRAEKRLHDEELYERILVILKMDLLELQENR